ncbi:MAG TPA: DUF3891 family protein, partial [Solirubrobacteraceae bacterium]|nr:DUF3891 family protein [Solirubrobacteraceae bacterium]
MLVSRRDDGLWLVTHPDHAALAAELARAYGNDELPLRAQRESLVTAAGRHDDGWAEIDARPAIAEDEGRPAHFLEVALPDTVEPYRAGVDRIYADDRYAGVLASRHWAGLYRARWGTADAPPVGHPLAGEVVAAEDQRAARTALELWDGAGPRSAFEAELWRDYEVLQA